MLDIDFYTFLSSFSKVETVLGLMAFLIACFFAYLSRRSKIKYGAIANIIEMANTRSKSDLAIALSNSLPTYKIPDLSQEQGFEIVKLQLSQREREYKNRFQLLRLGMFLFFIIVLALVMKNFIDYSNSTKSNIETHGNQSPIVIGDSAQINFTDSTSAKK